VSARLKQGAKDLQATADQDNEFYQQVSSFACACVCCACVGVCCACVCVCERVEPLALYVYFAATRRALTVMQPCASGQKKAVVGRRLIPM
jgi:hypothetical protein